MAASKNNFNLLRFMFAGMVILSHAAELKDGTRNHELLTQLFGSISFGELAVDSFFIISGYLITKSWVGKPELFRFLKSRILRIYPGFLTTSLVCAFILGPVFGSGRYFSDFSYLHYALSAVFLKRPNIPEVFSLSPYPQVNGSMWTIFYEFVCYMVVLLLGLLGVYRKRLLLPMLSLLLALVFVLDAEQAIALGKAQSYVRLGMVFLIGSCFYVYEAAIRWKFGYALAACGLALLFLFDKRLAEVALGMFWGYAILYFANHAKEVPGFNRLPDISYGLYLYAWPVTKIIYWNWPDTGIYPCMLATLVISIALGACSWYLVEKPFMRLKRLPWPMATA